MLFRLTRVLVRLTRVLFRLTRVLFSITWYNMSSAVSHGLRLCHEVISLVYDRFVTERDITCGIISGIIL